MNLFQIISDIEKVDPEIYDRLDPRRAVFKHFAGYGKKLAASAVPLAMGAMFQKAYGQTTTGVAGVLNYALRLEYLEAEFYRQALAAPGLAATLTGAGRTAITAIYNHEVAHYKFLDAGIKAAGATPVSMPQPSAYDFTGSKGAKRTPLFPTVFTDYNTFLAVAQALEDTGVRAYKGQATALKGSKDLLQAALNIHSVEARHASHIRTMRRGLANAPGAPATAPKSWISGNDNGGPAPSATSAVYAGEENVTQAGANVQTLNGGVTLGANAGSEAFDEPLTMAQVLTIAENFFV
ncbi:ferritin-like domain-containing protein [Hymenobacter aerilatus]|uniref:Ferritin-like domain-containing protein n=1 Tax=Hymenobacter aerilatus TaxID=2932251 RepID=A0A8T9SXK7_9BACT|nr:ferritin-like domain-containing protein [Hymenobacter aerilatus]UOR05473.1 ferritin-like domain-containing protein [Hymenobacter aerilatus]